MDAELEYAIELISDRTGMFVPSEIVIFKESGFDDSSRFGTEVGNFDFVTGKITVNKAFFHKELAEAENLDDDKHKQWHILQAKKSKIRTIIHEYGHYLHHKYYDFQSKRIPVAGSRFARYCKKNGMENFAVAFAEYVMEEIPSDSPRYKRMETITKDMRMA